MEPTALILHKRLGDRIASRAGGAFRVIAPGPEDDRTAWLREYGAAARVLIVVGADVVDAALLDLLPNVAHIQMAGAGMDGIDLAEVARRGIRIENAGAVHAGEVADFAMALMLGARRNILVADAWVRSGRWTEQRPGPSRSLYGAKVGIAGLGHIGAAIARRIEPFDTEVAWWGPREKPEARWPRFGSLIELAQWCDILFVAVFAHEGTRGLISRPVIDAVGRDGLIVNVARGFVIDEPALISALREGRLGQAALDVFATEPTPPEQWRTLPNVVLAPHVAGLTNKTGARLIDHTAGRIRAVLLGDPGSA